MPELSLRKHFRPLHRLIYFGHVSTLAELIDAIAATNRRRRGFVLFLAYDARTVSNEVVFAAARQLLHLGMSYIVAWGPDCERVHDIFDDADIEQNPDSNRGSDSVIMSTWHADEPIEQALWFALHSAYPAPGYEASTGSTIVAIIKNATWAEAVSAYLDNPSTLEAAVGV